MPVVTLQKTNTIGKDTYIDQNAPTSNFGTNAALVVGTGTTTTQNKRMLLKFDLGLIPNDANINSATLNLYFTGSVGMGSRTLNIHQITSDWEDTSATWNVQPTFNPTASSSKSVSLQSSGGYIGFSVTSLVQSLVNGAPNYGFLIKDSVEGDSLNQSMNFSSFDQTSNQPTLTIDYTIPTTGKKQVEVIAVANASGASATTYSPTIPVSAQPGDLIAVLLTSGSNTAVTASAGWTKQYEVISGSNTESLFAKIIGSGEAAPVFSSSVARTWNATSMVFRNAKSVLTTSRQAITSGVSYTPSPSGASVSSTKSLYVLLNTAAGGTTFTPPLSYIELQDTAAGLWQHEIAYRYMHDKLTQTGAEMTSAASVSTNGFSGLIVLEPLTNNPPTITLTSPTDNQTLTEGSAYTLAGTVSDADAGQALSVKYSIGGGPTQSITLGTSDGTTAKAFSKTLTYSAGRFWDGSTDVSGLLPAEASSIQIWANDSSDDSAKVTRNFTIVQEDGKLYVPVNVVNQAYLVSQMARPVRLSNGWLVGTLKDSTTMRFYRSENNGKSWIAYSRTVSTLNEYSIVAKGTTVYITYTFSDGSGARCLRFNALETVGDPIASSVNLDSGQTATGAISAAITPDGTRLWWAASTQNNTYPNSFNIRAGSIPINADGTLGTPSAITQVTTQSTSVEDNVNPFILFKADGTPVLFYLFTGSNSVYSRVWNGSSWNAVNIIYSGTPTYSQSNPIGCTTPNGKLHSAWHGTDAADTVNPYIRYSNSSDGTTWLATPRKLVKGTNASITSDKNGKLTITYEDGGYIKRIESTNEFVSYSGPFTVGAGTKPVTFYDQSFQTDFTIFTIPPTLYQAAGAVKYYGVLNRNKKPVVTLNTPDNQVLTEQATLAISGTALDEDVDNAVTVKYRINGGTARNIASGVSDGSTPISFARTLTYSNKRIWDGAVDVAGVDLAENTDHILTVWSEDDQGGKSVEVMRKFRVVWNRPPTISGENGDLGIMEAPPSVNYTVSDPEGSTFTLTEKINGQVIRTFAGVAGRQETITIPHDMWLRLEPGVQHALTIEAADDQGMTSIRTYTLTRFVDKIIVSMDFATMKPETKDFFTTDVAAKRLLLTPIWDLPPGAILQVEVCNNAYDEEPAWEDATIVVKLNRAHLFANESKTAERWGINFRIKIEKGTAIGPIYVKGIGGAFD